jgi:hypothetical protein
VVVEAVVLATQLAEAQLLQGRATMAATATCLLMEELLAVVAEALAQLEEQAPSV